SGSKHSRPAVLRRGRKAVAGPAGGDPAQQPATTAAATAAATATATAAATAAAAAQTRAGRRAADEPLEPADPATAKRQKIWDTSFVAEPCNFTLGML